MKSYHSCSAPISDDQGSDTCSMCYGDIDHGKDNYYRNEIELYEKEELEEERRERER